VIEYKCWLSTIVLVFGVIDRTFVIEADEGANAVYYAFNGRVSQFQIDSAPGAEAKCTFTIHPRGNQFGWSNNA